jgi:hypothetical protein
MDITSAVIIGVTLVPVWGTVLGWISESVGICPACKHSEHWPWCRQCGCDLFTEPEDR